MSDVKLNVDGREISLSAEITSIGRTTDNFISFPDDPNVSRFHAEIENRDGEYCLIDLGSSNGTTVNDERVKGEKYLSSGDVIVLGGTSRIEFGSASAEPAEEEAAKAPSSPSAAVAASTPAASEDAPSGSSGSKTVLIVAGVVVCIAVLFVVIAAAIFMFTGNSHGGSGGGSSGGSGGIFSSIFGSSCDAKATITKPENGDMLFEATEIAVDVDNGECVAKAVFTIDGTAFTSAESPFNATIDPSDFPALADGVDHSLAIVLLDEDGQPVGQDASVMLAFETRAVAKPKDEIEVTQTNTQQTVPTTGGSKQVSLIEVQEMSKRLVQQFAGKREYNVSNKQFLTEVQKRTADYVQEGYFERALKYRDAINVAFVREQNIDAPLGFLLAMSRSKFDPAKQGSDEGLWRMNTQFITDNAYNGPCGNEPVSHPSQNCAAKSAALYLKSILFGVFDGDPIYSAAVFGKSPQDAGVWKATLPANRVDIWNVIKTPQEREQLIRFFAAGIVAENPDKFGLKKDRRLSELYKTAM
ncbi:MAG: FHA domain-containing protein [Pyrinomonadaceae bacterium]